MYAAVGCVGVFTCPHCGSIHTSVTIWKSPAPSLSSLPASPSAVPEFTEFKTVSKYQIHSSLIQNNTLVGFFVRIAVPVESRSGNNVRRKQNILDGAGMQTFVRRSSHLNFQHHVDYSSRGVRKTEALGQSHSANTPSHYFVSQWNNRFCATTSKNQSNLKIGVSIRRKNFNLLRWQWTCIDAWSLAIQRFLRRYLLRDSRKNPRNRCGIEPRQNDSRNRLHERFLDVPEPSTVI